MGFYSEQLVKRLLDLVLVCIFIREGFRSCLMDLLLTLEETGRQMEFPYRRCVWDRLGDAK